jgi:hypothetical protein
MLDAEQIALRLARFRADLPKLPAPIIVRRHVLFGDCFSLNEDQHFELKQEVADHFEIHPNEVYVVGSAKQGFSIAPTKRYRSFSDTSDIDVAVVSPSLFDRIWLDVFRYKVSGGYWDREDSFKDYLFRGWIRPDKLPPARQFAFAARWWEFFRALTASERYGPYKVSAGLYRQANFLEEYQANCVVHCQSDLS